MLIVDTGPLVAYLNRNDPDHERCAMLLESRTDDLLVTPYVVTEACYLVGKYVGAEAEINLVEALAAGDLKQIDIVAGDLIRIAALMRQHMGFPLGVADASVIAAARRLLTLIFYGLRDGADPLPVQPARQPARDARAGGMNSSSWPAPRREVARSSAPPPAAAQAPNVIDPA